MKKPNTFIVGAPKCGTTAMHDYLSQHPEIFACQPKEPHYFVQEDFPNWWRRTEQEYHSLFETAQDEKIVLESSVWYLYSQTSIKKIRDYNKDAKIIIMLRRPAEMIHACHGENYKNRQDDKKDIKESWKLIAERKKGLCIPKTCKAEQILFYDKVAAYEEQIKRALRYFPRNRMFFVIFDEFIDSPKKIYDDLLIFLGVSEFDQCSFKKINESKAIKSPLVADITRGHPKFIFNVYRKIKKRLGFNGFNLMKIFRSINEYKKPREVLPAEIEKEIVQKHLSDVLFLERFLDKKLDRWKV